MSRHQYLGVMVTVVLYIITLLGPASGYDSGDLLEQTNATDLTEATAAEDISRVRCIACPSGCDHCHQYVNGQCRPIFGCQ
ncbi:hypothetical protein O3P69_015045 [Scylla paramamosain]|uniref:Uncharacterized protein n=1 Tax=Scylla paramamosain TaxID=85552 RepID=A0AAW0T4H3_SCYPA